MQKFYVVLLFGSTGFLGNQYVSSDETKAYDFLNDYRLYSEEPGSFLRMECWQNETFLGILHTRYQSRKPV